MTHDTDHISAGHRFTPIADPIPGPYVYHRDADGVDDLWVIRTEHGDRYVASIVFWDEPDDETASVTESTARLLCAAPELRDAVKTLLGVLEAVPGGLPVEAYAAEASATELLALIEGTFPS